MICHACGGPMQETVTGLPFKVSDTTIVILKELPVLQCGNCREYLIEDAVMQRVEAILEKADAATELEIVTYAA